MQWDPSPGFNSGSEQAPLGSYDVPTGERFEVDDSGEVVSIPGAIPCGGVLPEQGCRLTLGAEIQSLRVVSVDHTTPDAGKWAVTYGGDTSSCLSFDATAAQVSLRPRARKSMRVVCWSLRRTSTLELVRCQTRQPLLKRFAGLG